MSAEKIDRLEERRLDIQEALDAQKTQEARNKLGQFATPTKLARDLLGYLQKHHCGDRRVTFLDPAIGTGSFYSALRHSYPDRQIERATGYEIDPHYGGPAAALWGEEGLEYLLRFPERNP